MSRLLGLEHLAETKLAIEVTWSPLHTVYYFVDSGMASAEFVPFSGCHHVLRKRRRDVSRQGRLIPTSLKACGNHSPSAVGGESVRGHDAVNLYGPAVVFARDTKSRR